jgi:hypothetical protein
VEPVRYPTTVSRVTQADRVKRAQPRKDLGRRFAFARYLGRNTENSADSSHSSTEETDEAADAAPVESPSAGGSQTPQKRIDIRV